MKKGKVFLVGAGPGDVGLITVKGLEAIKQAEVILYDRLANPKLLENAPAECEFIYCGKLPDRHILRQDSINELLVAKALEGKRVVRLKGGDPGVFGRVGEEAASLAHNQISFEIIPGITSGIAAPLYAGIPVTHREYGESFAVITAHDKSKGGSPALDWEGLARGIDTIAFYMGVGNLPYICENLIANGKPSSTPVILIQWGTFGRQKTLQGTLADIAQKAAAAMFRNPSIILVGDVISLREKLSWFEKKPLYGRQILLARTSNGPSELAKELMDLGGDVIELPKWKKTLVHIDLEKVAVYDKILFAQPESAAEFFEALIDNQIDIRHIKAKFYGPSIKTIKALNDRGVTASLADEMPSSGSLLIVGDNSVLKNMENYELFDVMVTSQKEIDWQFMPIFNRMLGEAQIDTMIFPCSASIEPFLEALRKCDISIEEYVRNSLVVCMGKQTLAAARGAGLMDAQMPAKATKAALIEYLIENIGLEVRS